MSRIIFLLMLFIPISAFCHEVRPAYLEIMEIAEHEYSLKWKTPMRGNMRLGISPEFTGSHQVVQSPQNHKLDDSVIQTWQIKSKEGLRGQTINIKGLSSTMTDVLVRIKFINGDTWMKRLTPAHASANIPLEVSNLGVAWTYLGLGFEHILLGLDHLLFVFALLMINVGFRQLFMTITAFTVAHSITLAISVLGIIQVSIPPIEAIIALSIVFVAFNAVKKTEAQFSLIRDYPWVIAFVFGLIHGFGFASVLTDIGLPQSNIPLALLFFNIGVEIGQLAFIAISIFILKYFLNGLSHRLTKILPYIIGSIAMFWLIQRIALF